MTAPYWSGDGIALYLGDCAEILRAWPDSSVDAVVTDPPYELGFMGNTWDKTGDAFKHQVWAECLRILKPGGHLLAFGATRTYHRLTCAIEDAGFEVRDSINWIYGSGFPKSYDVGKAVDQAGGSSPAEQSAVLRTARERAGLTRDQVAATVGCTTSSVRDWEEGRARGAGRPVEHIVPSAQYRARLADLLGYTADERAIAGVRTDRRGDGTVIGLGHSGVEYGRPVTKEAVRWDGWGTALKPAHEPIVLSRKPLLGTVVETVLEYGTGALHIGACRVPPTGESRPRVDEASQERRYTERGSTNLAALPGVRGGDPAGRWPTNVVLSHPPLVVDGEVVGDACASGCVDGCPVAELDRQSGDRPSGGRTWAEGDRDTEAWRRAEGRTDIATRSAYDRGRDSGGASRFFPTFRYEAKAPAHERPRLPDGTAHSTVKPLALMRWLVRLVTPPGGTVLDPFAGSGTTGEAAVIEGFRAVLIEREESYAELIKARLSKPIPMALFGDLS